MLFSRSNSSLNHIQFSFIFVTLLYVVCNVLLGDKVSQWFVVNGELQVLGLLAYLIFGWFFSIAFFLLFAHRYLIKLVAVIFILFSAASTYFIVKYNVAIDTSMIRNVIHTDATEVSALLSWQILPFAVFLIVLPIWLVVRQKINFKGRFFYLLQSLLAFVIFLFTGIGMVYAKYDLIHQAGNVSNKYIVHSLVPVNFIRSISSLIHQNIVEYQRLQNKNIVIDGEVTDTNDLLMVLAIGESSRQKSFELYGNTRKPTNPLLSQVEDLTVLNGQAEIGTTLLALEQILERDDIKLPAITSQLGIETKCLSNFHLYDNCDAVEEIMVSNCGNGGKCYDEDVLTLLKQQLSEYQSGKKFLILHLGGGSHGPIYSYRYPESFQIFKPLCEDADVINQCTREELYNAYDNSILYVDFVLNEIITELEDSKLPYVMIYLSDHGESLLEGGKIFHGMPPGIALPPEQADVPLLVKSSIPIQIKQWPAYEQPDVFDTVLNLLSIKTDLLRKERSFIDLQHEPTATVLEK